MKWKPLWKNLDLEYLEMNNIEINIHQATPDCLVYYTIKVGEWVCDGDARNVTSALKLIAHNLKWDYRDYENELEDEE